MTHLRLVTTDDDDPTPPAGGACATRFTDGPTKLGDVVRMLFPCQPRGGGCHGRYQPKVVVEPAEDGLFRVARTTCESSESEVASHLLVSGRRTEGRDEREQHNANNEDCVEKGHVRFRWAA